MSDSATESQEPISSLVETISGKPKALSSTGATSLALGSSSDSVRYYESATGKAFQANLRTGKNELLSGTALPGFLSTLWSPSGHEVISLFDRSGSRIFQYYNYSDQRSAPVGTSVTAVAFSPDGRKLAFVDTVDGASAVYVGNADGTDSRKVLAIRATDPVLSWPQESLITFVSRRPDRAGSDLVGLTLDGKLSVILSNKENLEHRWSRDGSQLLFSYFIQGQGIQLWRMDMASGITEPLPISTGANKCAWAPAGTEIACGVPPDGALSQSVASDRTATLDDIVIVSIPSGVQEKVYTAQKGVLLGVGEPLVSSSAGFLAFVNLFDRRLYQVELP